MCALCGSWRSCQKNLPHDASCHFVWAGNLLQMILHSLCWQPAIAVNGKSQQSRLSTSCCLKSPNARCLKVKGMAADSPGKSLISQRFSPIWSSAVRRRAAGAAAVCQEDPLKASAASYSPVLLFFLQKWHLLTAQLLCMSFCPQEKCVRWCNHDVRLDFSGGHAKKKTKKGFA